MSFRTCDASAQKSDSQLTGKTPTCSTEGSCCLMMPRPSCRRPTAPSPSFLMSGLKKEEMMERHRIMRRTLDPLAAAGPACTASPRRERVISPAAAVGLGAGEERAAACTCSLCAWPPPLLDSSVPITCPRNAFTAALVTISHHYPSTVLHKAQAWHAAWRLPSHAPLDRFGLLINTG